MKAADRCISTLLLQARAVDRYHTYLGMKGEGSRQVSLFTGDSDPVPKLHPGHAEDGAGVGRGQTELVHLVMVQ